MRTRVNLATAPLENNRRSYVLAGLIGIPALILFAWLSFQVAGDRAASRQRREEVARLESEIAKNRRERAELEEFFDLPATRLLTQRAAFLNAIIDQRSFPWTDFFIDVEKRLPGGVHVIQLVPTLVEDHVAVKLRVGALSDKSKLEFLKALESAPEFSHLELLSEARAMGREERDVVQMDLTAEYRPVSASAGKTRAAAGGTE